MDALSLAENGWPCPSGDEMARIDRDAIERRGLPGRVLMETAGRAVARVILERYPSVRRPLVVCGPGNNGGDGFVVARVLREWRRDCAPRVLALGDPARASDETQENFKLLSTAGVQVTADLQKEGEAWLEECDLIVDALFGVGLARPLEGMLRSLVERISAQPAPVVAIDLPSGLDAASGRPLGSAVRADLTVTLGLPKLGLAVLASEGPVVVADIGLPAVSVEAVAPLQHVWTRAAAGRRLPARSAQGHKGSFGHAFIVAGSLGKTGAGALSAQGALCAGAGLVTLACARSLNSIFEIKLTEAMTLPFGEPGATQLTPRDVARLLAEAQSRDVTLVGPGLGAAPETFEAIRQLLSQLERPAVVDADGLNAFAGNPEALRASAPRILTPHPGEAGRLLGRETAEVQSDRVAAVRALAALSGAVVVLKGARTLIALPSGELRVNSTGGPGLASGGSGDVLAGVIAALLGQRVAAFDAASLGAYVHGLAGDLLGPIARASEIATILPRAFAQLRDAQEEPLEPVEERSFP